MAINFNDKVLVTNPTSYGLGWAILIVGMLTIFTGGVTYFAGDLVMPPMAWVICGLPPTFIGWAVMRSGVRKN